MITEGTTIKSLGRGSAFETAQAYYVEKSSVPFVQDLADYLQNGFVLCRPTAFGMAKIIDLAEREGEPIEPAWFVRMAVGSLDELLSMLPCFLPIICFCRRGDGRIRKYPLDRLLKLVSKINKKE